MYIVKVKWRKMLKEKYGGRRKKWNPIMKYISFKWFFSVISLRYYLILFPCFHFPFSLCLNVLKVKIISLYVSLASPLTFASSSHPPALNIIVIYVRRTIMFPGSQFSLLFSLESLPWISSASCDGVPCFTTFNLRWWRNTAKYVNCHVLLVHMDKK